VRGAKRLVIDLEDNGSGMTPDVLAQDFGGLGFSRARERDNAIGEKGHGTKIYLRSQRVEVRTQITDGAFEAVCDAPLEALSQRRLHEPQFRSIPPFREGTGTHVRIVGYNDNERSRFRQDLVRDYLLWFTKLGSVERVLGYDRLQSFRVSLQALDVSAPEWLGFGHVFPAENSDIERLFEHLSTRAADYYARRFVHKDQRLPNHPEITFDLVISVEGDEAKREYNPMIRERRRSDTGTYLRLPPRLTQTVKTPLAVR